MEVKLRLISIFFRINTVCVINYRNQPTVIAEKDFWIDEKPIDKFTEYDFILNASSPVKTFITIILISVCPVLYAWNLKNSWLTFDI